MSTGAKDVETTVKHRVSARWCKIQKRVDYGLIYRKAMCIVARYSFHFTAQPVGASNSPDESFGIVRNGSVDSQGFFPFA
jgi:hypothetical protein